MSELKGKIVQVSGPVVDVEFKDNDLPAIRDALYVMVGDEKRVMEVSQHIGLGASHQKANLRFRTGTGLPDQFGGFPAEIVFAVAGGAHEIGGGKCFQYPGMGAYHIIRAQSGASRGNRIFIKIS